jgi:hypothetical protein
VLPQDAVHHRQAQADTVAAHLRGEEGLEDVIEVLGRNPFAGVLHLQPDLGVRRVHGAAQLQPPAVGHGVHGVE